MLRYSTYINFGQGSITVRRAAYTAVPKAALALLILHLEPPLGAPKGGSISLLVARTNLRLDIEP
jgi:hypothetical protein